MKYLIVDGSNVARELYGYNRELRTRERLKKDNQHSKTLLKLMAAFQRRLGIPQIRVYFDGTVRPQAIGYNKLPISICVEFSCGVKADELIVREAMRAPDAREDIAVATDDRELQRRIMRLGICAILPVSAFEPMAQDAGLNTELYFQSA
jgi:predicted RNA-binding protein with PIN domain